MNLVKSLSVDSVTYNIYTAKKFKSSKVRYLNNLYFINDKALQFKYFAVFNW